MVRVRTLSLTLTVVLLSALTWALPTPARAAPPTQQAVAAERCTPTSKDTGYCTRKAAPRNVSKLAGAARLAAQSGWRYTPLTTIARLADTRPDSGSTYEGQTLGAGGLLNIKVAGVAGVPASGVGAVVLGVTAVSPSAATTIRVFATGSTKPGTSTISAPANINSINQTVVRVGTLGRVTVENTQGSVNLLVEVMGYYSTTGAGYVSIQPKRLADTRAGSAYLGAGHTLVEGGTLHLPIAGQPGVPQDAVAAIFQVTTLAPTKSGQLMIYPAGTTRPLSSVIRFRANEGTTKEATVRLGTSPRGAVKVYNPTGSVDIVVDVVGYYVPRNAETFDLVAPSRIADTRTGSGKPYAGQHVPAGGVLTIDTTAGGVPDGATSAVVNIVIPSGATPSRWLTAYAAGTTRPGVRSLTYTGTTAVNEVTVRVDSTGKFSIYNSTGTSDIVVDLLGFYLPSNDEPSPELPPESGVCNFDAADFSEAPNRYTSCSVGYWEIYEYDGDVIVGHINLVTFQWIGFSVTSNTWSHAVKIVPFEARGTMLFGTMVTITPSCVASPDCEVIGSEDTTWAASKALTPGISYVNTYTERDTSAAATAPSTVSIRQDRLGLVVAGTGGSAGTWTFRDDFMTGRCDFDSTLSSSQRGCVNYKFIPTLVLRLSQGGASAAFVHWAQLNLSGHWGLKGQGGPLHYAKADDSTSRYNMCVRTFVADAAMTAALAGPYQDQDTCDEFPFFGTYENPGRSGQIADGSECAQLTAVRVPSPTGLSEPADWPNVDLIGSYNSSALCARGHIPGKLNSSVGGSFGNFTRPSGQRLIDGDPFWIEITS